MRYTPVERLLALLFGTTLVVTVPYATFLLGRRAPNVAEAAVFEPSPLPAQVDSEPVLRIHLAGAVKRPGVYRLELDCRVVDALERAGGATPGARLDDLNLAARLTDGMRLYVPGPRDGPADEVVVVTEEVYIHAPPAERSAEQPEGPPPPRETYLTQGKPAPTSQRKAPPRRPVNLNRAALAELQTLPGIGPAMATRIIAWRATHGRFARPEDLLEVKGIGEKTL
ncbi:MAG: helix-hairpin-helix domain-containing protein, partial [Armatimonadetes bacterium]|nr:helix-hairpin-helix domain-containing protein [Armatimonadota bacterium]